MRIVSWLVTIVVLAFYVVSANGTIAALQSLGHGIHRYDPALGILVLGPLLCALCATLTLLYVGFAKPASPRAKEWWALLLFCAAFGWPVSWLAGAVMMASGTSWVSH